MTGATGNGERAQQAAQLFTYCLPCISDACRRSGFCAVFSKLCVSVKLLCRRPTCRRLISLLQNSVSVAFLQCTPSRSAGTPTAPAQTTQRATCASTSCLSCCAC
jgi:hypothetical protein